MKLAKWCTLLLKKYYIIYKKKKNKYSNKYIP